MEPARDNSRGDTRCSTLSARQSANAAAQRRYLRDAGEQRHTSACFHSAASMRTRKPQRTHGPSGGAPADRHAAPPPGSSAMHVHSHSACMSTNCRHARRHCAGRRRLRCSRQIPAMRAGTAAAAGTRAPPQHVRLASAALWHMLCAAAAQHSVCTVCLIACMVLSESPGDPAQSRRMLNVDTGDPSSSGQCWAPSCIVASAVMKIIPRKYESFYEVGPDLPALAAAHPHARAIGMAKRRCSSACKTGLLTQVHYTQQRMHMHACHAGHGSTQLSPHPPVHPSPVESAEALTPQP